MNDYNSQPTRLWPSAWQEWHQLTWLTHVHFKATGSWSRQPSQTEMSHKAKIIDRQKREPNSAVWIQKLKRLEVKITRRQITSQSNNWSCPTKEQGSNLQLPKQKPCFLESLIMRSLYVFPTPTLLSGDTVWGYSSQQGQEEYSLL